LNDENDVEQPELTVERGWVDELNVCLGVLTRVPVIVFVGSGGGEVSGASRFFPVIGLGIGTVGAIILLVAVGLGLAAPIASLLALASIALLTGAMHEDGLADSCDGLGAGKEPGEILEIMRDSRIGAYGVLGLIFSVGLRWAALAALTAADWAGAALTLVAAASLSRGLLPACMHYVPAARDDGLSAGAGRPEFDRVALSALIGAAAAILCLGFGLGILVICVSAGLVALFVYWAHHRVGGQTGDILGAAQQIAETAILLTAAAVLA
jgi:adenosylcobinamide-GDP ribazoletransferase